MMDYCDAGFVLGILLGLVCFVIVVLLFNNKKGG